jgi:hypothetical protein
MFDLLSLDRDHCKEVITSLAPEGLIQELAFPRPIEHKFINCKGHG